MVNCLEEVHDHALGNDSTWSYLQELLPDSARIVPAAGAVKWMWGGMRSDLDEMDEGEMDKAEMDEG